MDTPLRGIGEAVGGVPLPNTLEGPQFLPQPQPFHFVVRRVPPAMVEKGKFDHIEERLRVIEGGRGYAFTDMEDLCLVPDVVIPMCKRKASRIILMMPRNFKDHSR